MEIAFVTNYPSLSITNWSGLEYYISNSIQNQGHNIDVIANLEKRRNLSFRIKNKIYGRNHKYDFERSPEAGRCYAQQILQKLKPSTDIVFAASSIPISYLKTDKPKAFYTDATFASMIDYYDALRNLSPQTIREGLKMEKKALATSSLAIYSSDWAANSAIKDLGADPSKIKVIPFGANINNAPSFEDVKLLIRRRLTDDQKCNILFIGVEWYRKGGDIALDAVRYLNEELKLSTTLHIVGIDQLPVENLPSYAINHGRISKATPEGLRKIEDLISQSHFLFLPTRADCTPVVFSESMAFGVPCVSTDTGGIPTIIKNNQNGILLDYESSAKEYAEQVYRIFSDKKLYEDISLYAYNDYTTRLNWDVAGKTISDYLKEL